MNTTLAYLASASLGYLLGSLPIGYFLVLVAKGIDVREVASGRTGGTNAYRAAGRAVGLLTGLGDILKGAAAVMLVRLLFTNAIGEDNIVWAVAFSGIMVVIGHNWSIFLGWVGGAGTTPNIGWAAVIWLPILPIALILLLFALFAVGIASVASLAVAAAVPLSFTLLYFFGPEEYHELAYPLAGLATATIIAWSLRPNIKRLLQGTERVVGPRARKMKQQAESD